MTGREYKLMLPVVEELQSRGWLIDRVHSRGFAFYRPIRGGTTFCDVSMNVYKGDSVVCIDDIPAEQKLASAHFQLNTSMP